MTPGAIAQYLLLFEVAGGERLEQLVDDSRHFLRLSVRLADGRFREAARIGNEIQRIAEATLAGHASSEPAGLQYLLGDWLDELIMGQRRGVGFAILSVAVMMILGLASVRVGLWSMIPNLLPLLALGGLLGYLWDGVDSDVASVAMIAVGIGVDDTIHYLMRLRLEWQRHDNVSDAVAAAMDYAGRGIIITTIILVLGFLPFAFSGYLSLRFFGTLLPFCLVVALLADLVLVPAMVQIGWIRFPAARGLIRRASDAV